MRPLFLASTSTYRQKLLLKLGVPFVSHRPDFDEDGAKDRALREDMAPVKIAEMLSRGKGRSLAQGEPGAVVISGDQLVHFEDQIIGKSKNFETAHQQLSQMRGRWHELITSVTITTGDEIRHLNHVTRLKMKALHDNEIRQYLQRDLPYDCAGSYKIEESGIALFSEIECSDFTAIQGLPLLWVSEQLKELGYELFKN